MVSESKIGLFFSLDYSRQQSPNRRVIACPRTVEKVRDGALRHDNEGPTKL
jgi:hypothetical protein